MANKIYNMLVGGGWDFSEDNPTGIKWVPLGMEEFHFRVATVHGGV